METLATLFCDVWWWCAKVLSYMYKSCPRVRRSGLRRDQRAVSKMQRKWMPRERKVVRMGPFYLLHGALWRWNKKSIENLYQSTGGIWREGVCWKQPRRTVVQRVSVSNSRRADVMGCLERMLGFLWQWNKEKITILHQPSPGQWWGGLHRTKGRVPIMQ